MAPTGPQPARHAWCWSHALALALQRAAGRSLLLEAPSDRAPPPLSLSAAPVPWRAFRLPDMPSCHEDPEVEASPCFCLHLGDGQKGRIPAGWTPGALPTPCHWRVLLGFPEVPAGPTCPWDSSWSLEPSGTQDLPTCQLCASAAKDRLEGVEVTFLVHSPFWNSCHWGVTPSRDREETCPAPQTGHPIKVGPALPPHALGSGRARVGRRHPQVPRGPHGNCLGGTCLGGPTAGPGAGSTSCGTDPAASAVRRFHAAPMAGGLTLLVRTPDSQGGSQLPQ